MGTTAKDERLALRLTRSQRKALEAAATATGSTLTEFSVAAILARAEDVLGSRAVFEVDEQEKALGVFFDTIIVCTVTGSTHAGMIAGFAALEELTGVRRRVIGIDASATLEQTRDQVGRIARHTSELIELGRDLRDDEITVLEGWAGELYGVPVDSTMEAIRLGAQLEAMITDPVYEGKSLAGLIDLVRSGDIPATSTVLYAHLGGQPAINAYHRLWS